jgi:hypothetical protein
MTQKMKRLSKEALINSGNAVLAAILFCCCLVFPNIALAFADAPVAVVILDRGDAGEKMTGYWTEMVRRRFHFPAYKLIEQKVLREALRGKLPLPEKRSPHYRKAQLKHIADLAPAELVFVIFVDRLSEMVIPPRWPLGDTLLRVEVAIDLAAYRVADGKYLEKKIRYFKTDLYATSFSAGRIANDGVGDAIAEFRDKLPDLAEGGTGSGG